LRTHLGCPNLFFSDSKIGLFLCVQIDLRAYLPQSRINERRTSGADDCHLIPISGSIDQINEYLNSMANPKDNIELYSKLILYKINHNTEIPTA
jgi:hypothetical protein